MNQYIYSDINHHKLITSPTGHIDPYIFPGQKTGGMRPLRFARFETYDFLPSASLTNDSKEPGIWQPFIRTGAN